MFKISRRLIPIKAHFFFFMAAIGPILPQLNVLGKQLGIPPDVMGLITSVLPILYVLAKPAVGFLMDTYPDLRKTIFMSIITVMIFCFGCLSMLPTVPDFHLCIPKDANRTQELERAHCNSTCTTENLVDTSQCIYKTHTFWAFVIFMCMGTIGFNVGNCVSDAACFDILGDDSVKYGKQRVWGTIGFGVTALLAGVIVNLNSDSKDMQPAMYIMLVLGIFDIVSIKWLKLPSFTSSDERSISSKIMTLLKCRSIVIFLIFATIAGIFDSFIIYYLFWFLEEVAQETNYWESIKLIEGCVVAAECLGGEILFFLLSEKILKRIGYSHCLSFCFLMYSIRLGLISTIKNPLWLIVIEFFLQGPTYALCYTCIVAYASAVTPPGATATVQGLVAGMDDGLGFAIGSFLGGQLYSAFGGRMTFQIFSICAIATSIVHIILHPTRETTDKHSYRYDAPVEQIAAIEAEK